MPGLAEIVLVGLGYTTLCHGYRKTYLYVNSVTDEQIRSITGTAYSLFSRYGVEPNVGYSTQHQRYNIRIRINPNELADAVAINQHLQQEFCRRWLHPVQQRHAPRNAADIFRGDARSRRPFCHRACHACTAHPLFTSSVAQVPDEAPGPQSWHIFAPIYLDLTTPRIDAVRATAAHMIR